VLSGTRYLLTDLGFWIRTHPVRGALSVLAVVAVAAAAVLGISSLAGDDPDPVGPAPRVIVQQPEADEPTEEPSDLGFPAFATSNTTRVASAEPAATAAGVALATFPAAGSGGGPNAVTLVPAEDWAAGIAAASLAADPVDAPILLTDGDELPDLTTRALSALAPRGSAETQNRQVFAVGSAPEPEGVRTARVEGSGAAEIAAELALLRERLTDQGPEHIVIASSDDSELAMPAAAWAARSGDPVLFAQRDSVPEATLKVLERHPDVPVYVLGGEGVISAKAENQLAKASKAQVRRATDESEAVASAIAFARYVDGTFGWNINDPGHGFVIANASRAADAGAAAALSGSGTWGPLLLTDDANSLPADLEGYLLDMKPGYDEDPTRAVYNHVWIIGDPDAISVDFQVEVDEIAEVAPVRSGSGAPTLGPAPGTPEPETPDGGGGRQRGDRNR
jgi:hypothetical protein